jgi:hypothetical protein
MMVRAAANAVYNLERTPQAYESMMRDGRQLAMQSRQPHNLNLPSDTEFKVFSQFGEDGIIEWFVQRLAAIPERFVEFAWATTEGRIRFFASKSQLVRIDNGWVGYIQSLSHAQPYNVAI